MSVLTARTVEEAFTASKVFTGKNPVINDQTMPLQPARPNLLVISPREHLELQGRKIPASVITAAMEDRDYGPGHLLELLLIAANRQMWNKFTSTWALGQVGEQTMYGKKSSFYPMIWGRGAFHDLSITSVDSTWTDSDLFVVAQL